MDLCEYLNGKKIVERFVGQYQYLKQNNEKLMT